MSVTLSRRSVVRSLAVVVAGGIGGFLVARTSSAASGSTSGAAANGYGYHPSAAAPPRRLVALDAVPVGGGTVVGAANVVVTRSGSGDVHAFSAVCTHQGCRVSSVRRGVIVCPCHGSQFDARTGAVVAGPAPRPLPAVPVSVTGGVVYAQ